MQVTILAGDCIEQLATLPDASIDACVTDPPYELGFMGKKWDASGIAYRVALWREVLRVLKPGAHLLAFGGTRTYHRMTCAVEDAGFEIRDCLAWLFGSGFPKSLNLGEGFGTALKPAHDPIVLARKPFKGTVKANVEKFGTGALNIDAARIEGDPTHGSGASMGGIFGMKDVRVGRPNVIDDRGRWPANVALDEIAAMVLDEQSGELTSGELHDRYGETPSTGEVYGAYRQRSNAQHADSGGASRFYYVAKPSREERDYGTSGMPKVSPLDVTSRKDGSAGSKHGRAGMTGQARGNFHPTVKPVELMRWLVKLITPSNGLVLDPFMGSGTTGMACRYELRNFIGIEREAEYIAIAERRIAAVAPLFASEATA